MVLLKLIICLFLIFIVGVFYTTAFTSIPFTAISLLLNKIDGVQIEGAKGSLLNGFSVESIEIGENNDERRFLVKNIIADYELPKIEGNKKVIHITNIQLDRFEVVGLSKSKSSRKEKERHDSASKNKKSEENIIKKSQDLLIIIDQIAIKNIILKDNMESEGFFLENLIVRNSVVSKKGFQFESLDLNSNLLDLNGSSKFMKSGGVQINLEGVLKKNLLKHIKENIDFELLLEIVGGELKLKGSGFNNKLNIDLGPNNPGILALNNLDLKSIINDPLKISWLDGTFSLPTTKDIKFNSFKPLTSVHFKSNGEVFKLIPDTFKLTDLGENSYDIYFDGISPKGKVSVHLSYDKMSGHTISIDNI